MRIMSCPQNCHSHCDSQSHFNYLHSETPTLCSQGSLRSVPSLTSQAYLQQPHNFANTTYQCLATLKGHTSYICSLAVAGEYLYSGSSDKEIRLWKVDHLEYCEHNHDNLTDNVVAEGKGAVKSIVVLGDKLFCAHQDHKIRVWKINDNNESGKPKYARLATLPTLSDRAMKILMPKNHVQIRRHKKSTWVNHVDTVSALALSKDETLLYSVSWDRTFKIWRTNDFKCLESVSNAHDDAINALAISDDGCLYTGSADKKIKVWKKTKGEKKHSLVATLAKHNSGINALALSNDGSLLYSGACDRSILIWEKDDDGTRAVAGALRGHTNSILCLAVVSHLVCSGSADKTIRIWRNVDRNYSCLAVFEGHNGPVKCLAAAIDHYNQNDTSYRIYSGSLDCDIKVWHISDSML